MHTPGPWNSDEFSRRIEWSHWIMAGHAIVAAVLETPDARLIATAPDLLELVAASLPVMQVVYEDLVLLDPAAAVKMKGWLEKAEAATARAEGDTTNATLSDAAKPTDAAGHDGQPEEPQDAA